ncbi:Ldh family oxidoreductase [Thermus scotoductus]|uniref:Ldh family oxidoreductase n=1 Tax=Thermus scotoductus TaxID=37636 RepID=UPI0020A3E22C|nr:Ldh family oxidoreductase [Thermus scotoductus]
MRLSLEELHRTLEAHFLRLGLPEEGAKAFAEVLVEAELEGLRSHGLARLPLYTAQLERGGLNPRPEMHLSQVRPGLLLLEADGAPGPWAALRAVSALVPVAKEQGIAAVAVRRAGHVGPLGPLCPAPGPGGPGGPGFCQHPARPGPGAGLGNQPHRPGSPDGA